MIDLEKWKEILPHPSTALVTGKRGSGKSAIGYWLLENLSREYGIPPYVFGLPAEKAYLLKEVVKPTYELENLPDNSIIGFDEAHLNFHARKHGTDPNIIMDQLITISRQKGQILIFITQESRKLERNIISSVDCVIIKEPAIFQMEFERPELRRITKRAHKAYERIEKSERQKHAYVFSPNYMGLLDNSIPSFWSEELSRAFAGIPLEQGKDALLKKRIRKKFNVDEKEYVIFEIGDKIWLEELEEQEQ